MGFINPFSLDVIASSRRRPEISSWKNDKLPDHRKFETVKNHYKAPSGLKNERHERKWRRENVTKDPLGNDINWGAMRNITSEHESLKHMPIHIPETAQHHAVEKHPEITPQDITDTVKSPDNTAIGRLGGVHTTGHTPEALRVHAVKQVDTHTDGTPCYNMVTMQPRHNPQDGKTHLHVLTSHSVRGMSKKSFEPIDQDKIDEAGRYNTDKERERRAAKRERRRANRSTSRRDGSA